MLDPQLLRADAEAVQRQLADRGAEFDLENFQALEGQRKSLQVETEQLQGRRKQVSKAIGQAKGQGQDASELLAESNSIG
ncbi:MAG: serine--tRNA ligase, partial [Pseudomonadota bacterium]